MESPKIQIHKHIRSKSLNLKASKNKKGVRGNSIIMLIEKPMDVIATAALNLQITPVKHIKNKTPAMLQGCTKNLKKVRSHPHNIYCLQFLLLGLVHSYKINKIT